MAAKRLAMIAGLIVLLSTTSTQAAGPFMNWLCGCSSNMSSATTYAPAYVPTAVVPVQAAGCSSCAPQTTYFAPTVAVPAPVTTFRPFLPVVPRPTTTYYTPTGYNPYSHAPVTVLRPVVAVQPVVTTTRLIPYTSYRMVYPTAVSYFGVAPVYAAPVYAAPAVACPVPQSVVPAESYVPPVVGSSSEGDATEVPSLPPAQTSTSDYPPLYSPSTSNVEQPLASPTPPVTRQEYKPITPNEPTPAPKNESKEKDSSKDNDSTKSSTPPVIQHNSITNPPQDGSGDRTAMRAVRQVSRATAVTPPLEVRVLSNDLWRPAKD
jgi:hypothetical protein